MNRPRRLEFTKDFVFADGTVAETPRQLAHQIKASSQRADEVWMSFREGHLAKWLRYRGDEEIAQRVEYLRRQRSERTEVFPQLERMLATAMQPPGGVAATASRSTSAEPVMSATVLPAPAAELAAGGEPHPLGQPAYDLIGWQREEFRKFQRAETDFRRLERSSEEAARAGAQRVEADAETKRTEIRGRRGEVVQAVDTARASLFQVQLGEVLPLTPVDPGLVSAEGEPDEQLQRSVATAAAESLRVQTGAIILRVGKMLKRAMTLLPRAEKLANTSWDRELGGARQALATGEESVSATDVTRVREALTSAEQSEQIVRSAIADAVQQLSAGRSNLEGLVAAARAKSYAAGGCVVGMVITVAAWFGAAWLVSVRFGEGTVGRIAQSNGGDLWGLIAVLILLSWLLATAGMKWIRLSHLAEQIKDYEQLMLQLPQADQPSAPSSSRPFAARAPVRGLAAGVGLVAAATGALAWWLADTASNLGPVPSVPIEVVRTCASVSRQGNCVRKTRFLPGDRVYLYAVVSGRVLAESNQQPTDVSLEYTFDMVTPTKQEVRIGPVKVSGRVGVNGSARGLGEYRLSSDAPPGEYTARAEVRNKRNGGLGSASSTFTVTAKRAASPASPQRPRGAPEAPSMIRAFSQGATLVGEAKAQDDVWPIGLKVSTLHEATGGWAGELERATLASLHRVEGTVVGTHVTFKETAAIRRGAAVLGLCVYDLNLDQTGRRLIGDWSCVGQRGTVWLEFPPAKPTAGDSEGPPTAGPLDATPWGTWKGTVRQPEHWGNPYPVVLTLTETRVGAQVGRAEYPTLGCSHTLTLIERTERGLTVRQDLERGQCVNGNRVRVALNEAGNLAVEWLYPNGRSWMRSALTRTGRPIAPAAPALPDSAVPSVDRRTDTAAVETTALGTWEGTVTQPELPSRPYPIVLTLTGTASGAEVGIAEVSTFGCRYSLTLIERTDRALLVRLNLESGPRGCVNGTKVQLTVNEAGNLALEGFYPDGRSWVRSVLTRTAPHVAPRPIPLVRLPVETPSDKRAEEPAGVSIAGTWRGSASDNSGPGTLTLILSVSGANVTGTSSATDSKTGTSVSGTVSGTIRDNTFQGQLTFTYGRCRVTTSFTARLFGPSMSGRYAGRNSCAGSVTDGRFDLTKQ